MPDLAQKLEQYRWSALRAQESGNLSEAIRQLKLARTAIVLAPDTEIRQLSRQEFDREAIEALLADLEADRVSEINAANTGTAHNCLGALVCDPEHGDPLAP